MTMKDWIEALDSQITAHKRKVFIGKGTVSHAQAIKKAEQEFEIYRQREMEMLESDFDREIKNSKKRIDTTGSVSRSKEERGNEVVSTNNQLKLMKTKQNLGFSSSPKVPHKQKSTHERIVSA